MFRTYHKALGQTTLYDLQIILLLFLRLQVTGSTLCIDWITWCPCTVIPCCLREPIIILIPTAGVCLKIVATKLSSCSSEITENSLPSTDMPSSCSLRRSVRSEMLRVSAISLQRRSQFACKACSCSQFYMNSRPPRHM